MEVSKSPTQYSLHDPPVTENTACLFKNYSLPLGTETIFPAASNPGTNGITVFG